MLLCQTKHLEKQLLRKRLRCQHLMEVQVTLFRALKKNNFQKPNMTQVQIKATVMCLVVPLALNGSLCSVFACRQPFPAGDRVTFNGKECVCQKCTQPLPANSPAPIQAVHSQCPAKPPALHSINHTPSQSQKIFLHYLAVSEFCIAASPLSFNPNHTMW